MIITNQAYSMTIIAEKGGVGMKVHKVKAQIVCMVTFVARGRPVAATANNLSPAAVACRRQEDCTSILKGVPLRGGYYIVAIVHIG